MLLKNSKKEIGGVTYDSYYPSAMYLQGADPAVTTAMRTNNLTGTVQYTNRISLSGEYYFMRNLSAQGMGAYSFIFNNKGHGGVFANGLELTLSARYTIF